MTPETEQAIRDHAAAEFPKESCGLVIVVGGKERYYPCQNIAETPQEHFIMSPRDRAEAEDLGDVVAIVHSHPNAPAVASQADMVQCEAWGLPWHIVHVSGEPPEATDILTYEPTGYVAPLVGRTFSHGVLDCYSLVRDWYKQELDTELPDFDRRDDWWNRGGNLYVDNFQKAGFEVVRGPIEFGDIIFMQIRSPVPNHAAVYIGDGQIIHHVANRLSSRDLYDGYWQENTVMTVRMKK